MLSTDFHLTNHGSIYLLRALTSAARKWVDLNLPEDFTGAIEPRFVRDVLDGIADEGLTYV